LIGEHRPGFGAVLDTGVHFSAFIQQQLDEIEMVHVALANRIIAVLDIAVVRSDV